jgi:type IV secretory pathway TraG/TraD family ATPase VirD4
MANSAAASWSFQVWVREFKMSFELYLFVCLATMVTQILVFSFLIWLLHTPTELTNLWAYFKSGSISLFSKKTTGNFVVNGRKYDAESGLMFKSIRPVVRPYFWKIESSGLLSFLSWFSAPLLLAFFNKRASRLTQPTFLRGAKFVTVKKVKNGVKENGGASFGIGQDVFMAKGWEQQHQLGIGRSGSGKTTLVLQQINDLRKQGAKAVIYDPKADYFSRFYDPSKGDILFNPLDTRHIGWSPLRELKNAMDIDAVAGSLIPSSHSEDAFWNNGARAVFAGCLHNLNFTGETNNDAIWNFLHQDAEKVTQSLKKTGQPGYKYVEDATSKQSSGVFSTLEQYLGAFRYMSGSDGLFSVSDWVRDGKSGFIFITSSPDTMETLRPILSLFIDLLGRRLLSLPDDNKRRVYFIIDELGSLQRLTTFIQLLTLSRSKGGCVSAWIQDCGQIDRIYTKEHRQTIVNNCATAIIMSCKDPETAKFCSQKIGDCEIEEIETTDSVGAGDTREAVSFSRRKRIQPLVIPGEILHELPPYHFYLSMPGQQILRTETKVLILKKVAEEFIMRPELSLDSIAKEAVRTKEEASIAKMAGNAERSKIVKMAKERIKDESIDINVETEEIEEPVDSRWRDWEIEQQELQR